MSSRRVNICWKGISRAVQCPFGIRDLTVDECYSGMGLNRCKYFVCYDHHHGEPYGADIPNSGIPFTDIICKCPGSYMPFQLSLF